MRNLLYLFALTVTLSCKQDDPVPPPVADFAMSQLAGGVVEISNYSQNATSYAWQFGDGRTSTEAGPLTIKYDANGTQVITLKASNDRGGADQAIRTINIDTVIPQGQVTFWTDFASVPIDIFVEGRQIGTLTKYVAQGGPPACFMDGFAAALLKPGTYSFTAKSRDAKPLTWAGTFTVVNGNCTKMQLTI